MPLPYELMDEVVPESTAVIGDLEKFIVYVECGHAWRDWCDRIRYCVASTAPALGMVSSDIIQRSLEPPSYFDESASVLSAK